MLDENSIEDIIDKLVDEKMHEHGVDRIIGIPSDDFIIACEICGQKFNMKIGHRCEGYKDIDILTSWSEKELPKYERTRKRQRGRISERAK